jgi:hypothetical protein
MVIVELQITWSVEELGEHAVPLSYLPLFGGFSGCLKWKRLF